MQPNHHAAISNDFSIKNSSCSPTAKSPPSVCSYFYQKQLMQPNCQIPTLGMQLFLSKTAHAAQLPNPDLTISNRFKRFDLKKSLNDLMKNRFNDYRFNDFISI
jgi:hypothetical protein